MKIFFPNAVLVCVLAFTACGADSIYPKKSEIHDLIVAKYENEANIGYYKDGDVKNLECQTVKGEAICSFDFWSVNHKYKFTRINGNWAIQGEHQGT